jgi:SAM-dependent methyltransferase
MRFTYSDIFNVRGVDYHQAMVTDPNARRTEFETVVQLAELNEDQLIYDVPSGGCYLKNFIHKPIQLISVESAAEFIKQTEHSDYRDVVTCENLLNIPLASEQADRVISLAGTHHLTNQTAFYHEIYRLLRPGGIFCLADVRKGSGVAKFLNIFVDQYSSTGHQGIFLSASTQQELEAAGFKIAFAQPLTYYWRFRSVERMTHYCQLLFGIDRATQAQIRDNISRYLGYSVHQDNTCFLNWELYFWKATK